MPSSPTHSSPAPAPAPHRAAPTARLVQAISPLQGGARRLLALLLLFLLSLTPRLHAKPSEYQIKAAYLYNFAVFVTWPPESFDRPDSPLILGLVGGDPFGDSIAEIKGQKIGPRTVEVRTVNNPEEARKCHMVFFAGPLAGTKLEILARIASSPVLTIGETDGFVERGGIIRFFPRDNKIAFQVNDSQARQTELTISSQMLKIASTP